MTMADSAPGIVSDLPPKRKISPRGSWLTAIQKEFTPSRRRDTITAYLFLAPFLVFFSVFVLRSIIYSGYMSLHDWKILAPVQKLTKEPLGNYVELLNDDVWWLALKNSAIFSVLTVAGTTLLALGAAVILHRKPAGSSLFRAVFYAPNVLSVGVVAIIWGWLLNTDFGTINYVLQLLHLPKINWTGDPNIVLGTLAFITVWWGFGFPMLILLAGLQNIPESLYESARIDGANGWELFRYITIPLLRPALLFVTVTGFIAHFQVFGQPYFLTNKGGPGRASYTAIIYLYQAAWEAYRMGYAAAVSFTLAAILMAVTLIQFLVGGRNDSY
jgi:multiple sugar transport system permease protein